MDKPITITDKAAAQIQALMDGAPKGTQGVRLNIKPKGCSGNSYEMEYIPGGEALSGDDVFEEGDVKLYIRKCIAGCSSAWKLIMPRMNWVMRALPFQTRTNG